MEKSKFIDRELFILFSMIILMIIVGAVFIVNTLKKETLIKENTTYETLVEDISIVSLSDNSSIEGDFSGGGIGLLFVQSGKVGENYYYRFMMKNDDGKMLYHQLRADETYIYEFDKESGQEPRIEIEWEIKRVNGEVVSPSGYHKYYSTYSGFSDIKGVIKNVSIHVPKGTVDTNFSVDLK